MPPRFIARQLSSPKGFFGGIMGRLMNRHNAKLNAYADRQLDLTPSDRILEIGFGGGVTLPSLIAGAAFVGGIDRSRDMVRRANARFSEAVSAGRAIFREGNVEELPFEASSFGKVCTVNTVYFWNSLDAGFAEMHRVLSPGGRVVVAIVLRGNSAVAGARLSARRNRVRVGERAWNVWRVSLRRWAKCALCRRDFSGHRHWRRMRLRGEIDSR